MEEPVTFECLEGIARIRMNRPEAYNAFGLDMIRILAEKLVDFSRDPLVRGVVITGEGKAFCTGADLRWIAQSGRSHGEACYVIAAVYHQAVIEIRRMPKPVVAAINGLAAGGGFSMALACDFRVMEASALLRQAYTSNGLSMDGGGSYTLPRLVGLARAMEIAVLDRPIPAEQALSWGMVTEVVEDGRAMEGAIELVRRINRGSLSSFAASKRLLTDSFTTPFERQLERERELLAWCADQPNGREGISAFLEKRRPEYT